MGNGNLFNKVLVANRGEIAVRIVRACRELGVWAVAVYSEPDVDALHAKMADESHPIGPGPAKESYLNAGKILDVAEKSGVDAIHPGYGFLSENPSFARACEELGITFIGPPSPVIERMSAKTSARRAMADAGVPVVPGWDRAIGDENDAFEAAEKLGYPIAVKGVYTGGGRGICVVHGREELEGAFKKARSEAERYFGRSDVYLERYFEDARHIEFQIVADGVGHVVHLGERDCSIQRRRQKLIEEAPSPMVDASLRDEMGKTAVRGARAVGYSSLGTMEFLLGADGFYFLEANTRIQVEHPVTEMVTGIDLIKEQIRLAAGEELGYGQEDIEINGWAIECRINAEDPEKGFFPSPGRITSIRAPEGPNVRVDSGVYPGYFVPPFYDSLISKLIVWGRNRNEAVESLRKALDEFAIDGIKTTIPFHRNFWNGGNSHD